MSDLIRRVPTWGFSITEASYYGLRWGAHVGPWIVLFGKPKWPTGFMQCGRDCHYGDDNCNEYCCGSATYPPPIRKGTSHE
jgi:hypothetical protein